MMDRNLITWLMELFGTIAFAVSGAMVGAQRGMDIFGVIVLGVVTAVGGGIVRDLMLGITPPGVFQNGTMAGIAAGTAVVVFLILYLRKNILHEKHRELYNHVLLAMDSVGLGIFTVIGVQTGIRHGFTRSTVLLVFVGTITGVGGGLLRDMMAGVPPYIFTKHVYACASIVGALLCVIIYRMAGELPSLIVSVMVILMIRFLAAHYRWNLPRLTL